MTIYRLYTRYVPYIRQIFVTYNFNSFHFCDKQNIYLLQFHSVHVVSFLCHAYELKIAAVLQKSHYFL